MSSIDLLLHNWGWLLFVVLPIALDYWVIYVDDNYRHAVVGSPDRKYLWILSRSIQMDDATYRSLLGRAESQGYDTAGMIRARERSVTPDLDEEGQDGRFLRADGGVNDAGRETVD